VVRQSAKDEAAVVAAGITLHEALKAYDQLKSQGILVRIIDAYSIKPIDTETLFASAREVGNKLITVEDHWPEGGLGEAVMEAFAGYRGAQPDIVKLAVQALPGSGTPAELLDEAGINARHIVQAVRALVRGV
jgi:transketolase